MKISKEFRDVVMGQSGYFTTEQAFRLNDMSRQALNYNIVNNNIIERVEHGVYRLLTVQDTLFPDLIIKGIKAHGKAAISHKSALSYWNMSDEVPYSIYLKSFNGTIKNKDLRSFNDCIIETKGYPLEFDCDDVIALGEARITTPTRTLFDCVLGNCIQVESVEECLSSGKFNPYLLNEEQRALWDNNDLIKMINGKLLNEDGRSFKNPNI